MNATPLADGTRRRVMLSVVKDADSQTSAAVAFSFNHHLQVGAREFCGRGSERSHMETLMIHKLDSMKFTTQNDLY